MDSALSVILLFDESAHDTGGAFRTEADIVSPFVGELVHLLAYDIAALADTAFKECGLFENGGFDKLETIFFRNRGAVLEKIGKFFVLRRKDIFHAAQCCYHASNPSMFSLIFWWMRSIGSEAS
ncbi:hypothetical protein D3C81_1842090 [compost metagenome]